MGKIALILGFVIAVFPIDATENRRHVHVICRGKKRNQRHKGNTVAKIWIEKNGVKSVEVDWSTLNSTEESKILHAINQNWDEINSLIDKVFDGDKIRIITLNE